MRKIFIYFLLLLLVAGLLSVAIERGAGYVLIAVGGYTVEMTLVVALALLALAYFVLRFSLAMLNKLLHTREGVLGWAMNRRRLRGQNRTTQGLIAFVEGRWDYASRSLAKAAENSSTPLVNYLFAARASAELGDARAADEHLRSAALSTSGADIAIGLTQAELQMRNGQYEQALATLLRARKQANHHPVVLCLLADVYQHLGDWQALLKLLGVIRKHAAMEASEIVELEVRAGIASLGKESDGSSDVLQSCWRHLPTSTRTRPEVVMYYAGLLIDRGRHADAERLLCQQLQSGFNTDVVAVYGRTRGENATKQRAFCEKLLKINGDSAELLLALGRICLAANAIEDACKYLEKSYAIAPTQDVCAELGRHWARQGNLGKSNEYYRVGLASSIGENLLPAPIEKAVEEIASVVDATESAGSAGSPVFESVDQLQSLKV